MDKSQYDLCIEVLSRLDGAGILQDIVLVGSWCSLFYKDYFKGSEYMTSLTTRDIDLLIPHPRSIKNQIDVAELLKDLGFVVGFTGSQGYIRLQHPQLIVEFLVPERGRGSIKPYSLPQLGLNAQALRFLDFLSHDTITTQAGPVELTLPHPANFALHKLLVIKRRHNPEKQKKDKDAALRVLSGLSNCGQSEVVKNIFHSMPKKWQKTIINQLADITDKKYLGMLQE